MRTYLIIILLSIALPTLAQMPMVPGLPYGNQEAAGFNVDSLDELEARISNTPHKDFTGLVIIKDHRLVAEWYYNTFWRILDIRSAGKSITSLVLGAAIQDGLIESLDQDVHSFFTSEKYTMLQEDLKNVTIRHLLDMSSGLDADSDDSDTPGHAVHWGAREDWVSYILGIPLREEPGKRWVYADINVALIGAIIEEKSGKSLKDYAKEKVFDPLGIKQFFWYTNTSNQTVAAGTLYLSTMDFAKFGVLIANEGKWVDSQIVDPDYVSEIIGRKAFDLSDWWDLTDSYGMLWYKKQQTINGQTFDYRWASGRGGNQLIVVPDEELVIALTSTAYGPGYGHSRAYAILKAVLMAYASP